MDIFQNDKSIEIRPSLCDICTGTHCGLNVYVQGEQVVKVEGMQGHPVNDGHLCTKGASNKEYLYRENRIKTPLRRTGPRGSGQFQEISWEEAYEEIAAKLHGFKEKYGPESVIWYAGYSKWFRPWLRRLTHSFGSLNYGDEGSTCHMATHMAWTCIAGQYFLPDLEHNSDLFIGWGYNGMVSEYACARHVMEFQKRGGRLITIDIRDTPTGQKMSDWHIRIRPGTDGALALGLANRLIEHQWYDRAFVERYVSGFEEFCRLAAEYDPEKVSGITGIPTDVIEALARTYAEAKTVSIYTPSASIAHHINGFNSLRAIMALQVITGNIDREGTQLPAWQNLLYCNTGFETKEADFINSLRPTAAREKIATGRFPVWDAYMEEFQLGGLPQQILTGKPYELKALMAFGMNHRIYAQPGKMMEALDKLEFITAVDIQMTELCEHADVVLPACTSLERSEIKGYLGGYLTCTQPAIQPLYQSKPDAQILCELSKHLGLNDPLMEQGYEATQKYILSPLSLTLEELKAAGRPVRVPEWEAYKPGRLLEKGFDTPSGKLELYSTTIQEIRGERKELDPLPVFREGAGKADRLRYPMTFISGARIFNAVHSRLHEGMPKLRSLRPFPTADVHPEDARSKGICEGDDLIIESPAGKIQVKAHLTKTGSPGEVYLFHGYREADANELIPADHVDPYTGFPGYNQFCCDIKKAGSGETKAKPPLPPRNLPKPNEAEQGPKDRFSAVLDPKRCIACGACLMACMDHNDLGPEDFPPGTRMIRPGFRETYQGAAGDDSDGNREEGNRKRKSVSYRCDNCRESARQGVTPACVRTCPFDAIQLSF